MATPSMDSPARLILSTRFFKRKFSRKMFSSATKRVDQLNSVLVAEEDVPVYVELATRYIQRHVDFHDAFVEFQKWGEVEILAFSRRTTRSAVDGSKRGQGRGGDGLGNDRVLKFNAGSFQDIQCQNHDDHGSPFTSLVSSVFGRFHELCENLSFAMGRKLCVEPNEESLCRSACLALITKVAYLKDSMESNGCLKFLKSHIKADDADVWESIARFRKSLSRFSGAEARVHMSNILFAAMSTKRVDRPFEKSQIVFKKIAKHPAPHDKLSLLMHLEDTIWKECKDLTEDPVPDLFNSALIFVIVACSEKKQKNKDSCTSMQLESTLFLLQQFTIKDFGRVELMLTKFEVAIRTLEKRDNTVLFGSCPELPNVSSRMVAQSGDEAGVLRAQSLELIARSFWPNSRLLQDAERAVSSFDGSVGSFDGSVGSFYV